PSYGYPAVPPNWETLAHLTNNKPKAHSFVSTFAQFVWGGISEDTSQTKYSITPYPGSGAPGYGIGLAPYSYWRRNLDSYTQMMAVVDQNIGTVLDALAPRIAANTIVVFTSDHGDYVGAHGIPISKMCTAYDECFHMPLIVVDPTNRFTGDIGTIRENLTSHVDMLNLLVSLGNNGSQKWLKGPYLDIYGSRHNMIPMLKSASAAGRDYVLFATDELCAPQYIYNDASLHITALRTKTEKIATYSQWLPYTTTIKPGTTEVEFYDYSMASGRAETNSMPKDRRVPSLLKDLAYLVATELRRPLPGRYGVAQRAARERYIAFVQLINTGKILPGKLKQLLGFGQDF
ncbi:MAG TPA: sulfatase-like hydrolase/transferase, partial [Pseudolabrys sp.]|nr:sulfatase-like hydrolase/transferase [Pseudolabrys sp.]